MELFDTNCNLINATFTIARNSYGEFFRVGENIKNDSGKEIAIIEKFELDIEQNEIKAITNLGWIHLDFIKKA